MRLSDLHRRVSVAKPNLLLDEFPNSVSAYSLRKLRNSYTGNCIEVRRSSDNALQNIGFINDELDISSLISFVGAGSGFVRTWYDQSLNSINLINTATTSQPSIIISGVLNLVNNQPSINMGATSLLRSSTIFGSSTSIFSVFKNNDTIGVVYSGTTVGNDFIYAYRINNGTFFSGVTVSETYKNTLLQSLTTQTSVLNALGTDQILWTSLFTSVNIARYSNLQIGTSVLGGTDINWQELIVYDENKMAQRNNIESNINSYYNIF